ncbi:MAG: acireductone synthase [Acidobacteriota bacterium]
MGVSEGAKVRLVLLDIEGTTTPIAFVHDVLFPFARLRLGDWLTRHAGTDSRRDIVETLRVEHAADLARGEAVGPGYDNQDDNAVVAYATWLMDRDRKSPGLKRWQGLIWEEGYQAGLLHGEVYPDVPPAIRRWRMSGVDVAIYSSGSELAQRRLFASTAHGDLTPLFSGFFDTAVGPKTEPTSYRRIASALAHEPASTLFVSDVTHELRAADAAGCQTRLCLRPGNANQPDAGGYVTLTSFADIQLP